MVKVHNNDTRMTSMTSMNVFLVHDEHAKSISLLLAQSGTQNEGMRFFAESVVRRCSSK